MYGIIIIVLAFALVVSALIAVERHGLEVPSVIGNRLERLWQVAQRSIVAKRYLRAEKALLTILKLDGRNAAAYNHLGILYSRQKEYRDAIECFEIAGSIHTSAATLHNLGLIYFETEDYLKSAAAFEHALQLEDGLAARHIAYAKVLEQLGRFDEAAKHMLIATEKDSSKECLMLAYEMLLKYGFKEDAGRIKRRLLRLVKSASETAATQPQHHKLVY